jgi:uncharacterized membrane protein
MLLSLAALQGCASPPGGGVASGEEFKIVTPMFGATIKQGDAQTVTVTVHRGEYFKRDVTLEIKASQGISVDPTQILVKVSEAPDVSLRITVPSDAAIGKYKIFVKGTPARGQATSTEFTVKVVLP